MMLLSLPAALFARLRYQFSPTLVDIGVGPSGSCLALVLGEESMRYSVLPRVSIPTSSAPGITVGQLWFHMEPYAKSFTH